MIVVLVAGDAAYEYEAFNPADPRGAADLLDIPDALWRAYAAARQQVSDLGDAIEIVGRSVGVEDLDLVINAEHLVSHHGYNEAMVHRTSLTDLGIEHDHAHRGGDTKVPHVHGAG